MMKTHSPPLSIVECCNDSAWLELLRKLVLGILLMNSWNTDIFSSNYYHLQSVRFEFIK